MAGDAHPALSAPDDRDTGFACAVESMPAGFLRLDAGWRITYVNPEGQRLIGTAGGALVGRVLWEVFPGTIGSEFEWNYRHVRKTGKPVHFVAYYPEPLNAWYEIRAWTDLDRVMLLLYFLDITARHGAEEAAGRDAVRSRTLARLSEALAAATDQLEAAQRLATIAVPALADWCVVTLADGDRCHPGLAHRDRRRLADLRAYAAAAEEQAHPESPLWTMLASGAPFLVRQVLPATVERAFPDPVRRHLLGRLVPSSGMAVPLTARGRTLGVLELWNTAGRPAHTALEIGTAVEMGRRAGLAVDNAQLNARQQRMSETLQRSMLTDPVRIPQVELTVRYRPAAHEAQVGGDWYDAFRTTEGASCLVIGDVAGHDRDAAAAMGQLRNLLRGIAYTLGGRPGPVLAALDRAMRDLGAAALATAVLATVEPIDAAAVVGAHRLRWSNAGHPPPLLVEPDGSATLLRTSVDLLLGVDGGVRRDEHERLLLPGTTVLFYTDGLVERREATIDDGLDWLVKAAGELATRPLEDFCDGLLDEIGDYVQDDVAMLAFRIEADGHDRRRVAGRR